MSLIQHLNDSTSPIRAYVDGISPRLVDLRVHGVRAHPRADSLGLGRIAAAASQVPLPRGVNAATIGTAIDFRTRIALGGFDPHNSVSALGAVQLSREGFDVRNAAHRARVLDEAFEAAVSLLETSQNEDDIDRASVLLAYCEQVYRAGAEVVLEGSLGDALDLAKDGQEFSSMIDARSLADIRALMESNRTTVEGWQSQIASGERFEPNPRFAGSMLVGGADADWLIGDTLIECKTYASLSFTKLHGVLRQLLGYVMLDLEDEFSIRHVSLWLPRQRLTRTWSLGLLLGGDPDELLPILRRGFRKAADGQQIAARVPVTERRKHQILSDNKHTPHWMLNELARSLDEDIRFRVGRNAVTPESTLRDLARDKRTRVRQGVAMNENVPHDVLRILTEDPRVSVRRAAQSNPRMPDETATPMRGVESSWTQSTPIDANTHVPSPLPAGSSFSTIMRQAREDAALDIWWLGRFLIQFRDSPSSFEIPLPDESVRMAIELGQSITMPNSLKLAISEGVKLDLIRPGRHPLLRQFIAGNLPPSDRAIRDTLLTDADPEVRWSTLCNTVDTPDDDLGALLGKLATSRDDRIRFRTEGENKGPLNRTAAATCDRDVLGLVAAHPSTPVAALQALLDTKIPEIRIRLIENPSLPTADLVSIMDRIRSRSSVSTRKMLASSSRIPAVAANLLAEDRNIEVRTRLAANRAVSEEVLTKLAEDAEPSIRNAVMENPSTPATIFASLIVPLIESSHDDELLSSLRLAEGRSFLEIPKLIVEDALERLSKSRVRHPDMRIMTAAHSRTAPRTLNRLGKSKDEQVRRAVAKNTKATSETLSPLAADPSPLVRAAVAGNESIDTRLLVMLAHDDEANVRANAARNPLIGAALLNELLRDESATVRSAALSNRKTSSADRVRANATLEQEWLDSAPSHAEVAEMIASTRAEVRIQVARDRRSAPSALALLGGERRSVQVRRAVAANPSTPPQILASLADDKDAQVRQAVAFNSTTPPEVLAQLATRSLDLALIVTLNPDAPIELIDALAADGDQLISSTATEIRAARAASLETGSTSPAVESHHSAADARRALGP